MKVTLVSIQSFKVFRPKAKLSLFDLVVGEALAGRKKLGKVTSPALAQYFIVQ